ncbi:MAG: 30S ribosomal protein S4 [Syntrophales bacterium]|nr:30S ribosomal protein S4 [Syntrophales bacterium]MCK9527888.1 30S ribosomal protein S4 [Syntrophales bacterium]MDX9921938.1 30S ribosomal protein S4 [Syntrophales bacterium]
MARYRESQCKLCRTEGIKLFLKGDRCYSDKCAFERRGYAPGEHGQTRARKKRSDYGTQLREKQKLKRMYGLMEKQFKSFFYKAERGKGVTGTNLLLFLERRLDNMVYRMGFAGSRSDARQLVRHGHFLVNGRKVTIPSYLVAMGDTVAVREKSRKTVRILEAMDTVARRGVPQWIELDKDNFSALLKALPSREDLTMPVEEQMVVEFYSK